MLKKITIRVIDLAVQTIIAMIPMSAIVSIMVMVICYVTGTNMDFNSTIMRNCVVVLDAALSMICVLLMDVPFMCESYELDYED